MFPFSTMSAFVSVIFFGACRVKRILKIEESITPIASSIFIPFILGVPMGSKEISAVDWTGLVPLAGRRAALLALGLAAGFGVAEAFGSAGGGGSLGGGGLGIIAPASLSSPSAPMKSVLTC